VAGFYNEMSGAVEAINRIVPSAETKKETLEKELPENLNLQLT
jgi:hypothetical protein